MIFGMGAILYSGTVLLPQLAQQRLGYTATLAGMVLSPGAAMIILLIPVVSRILPYVQVRLVIAFGYFLLGCSYMYAHGVTPDASFTTLALMRASQTLGLAFLFVPISTITYSTMPRALNGDASALYVMLRNVAGSIGISLSTAGVTERTQIRQSYLSQHLNGFNPNYTALVDRTAHALQGMGRSAQQAAEQATGLIAQTLSFQSAILAYRDVFAYCAIAAFCIVPVALLFDGRTSRGAAPGGGH
jgi:DHA2 family multidrug resistance protein